MLSPSTSLDATLDRDGLSWIQTPEATIAKISGTLPAPRDWRALLDHLRPSSRPLVLWLRGRIWLGSAARTELAQAIGSSTVALLVNDDIGRGLATALRWMDTDVHAFDLAQLDDVDALLQLPSGMSLALLQRVI